MHISVRDAGTGAEATIVSNRIHPMFVSVPDGVQTPPSSEGHVYTGPVENGRWVDAGNLVAGYRLLGEDTSWSVVVSVEITEEPLEAYNLTVDDWHTYFVHADLTDGIDAVWVHNACNPKDLFDSEAMELSDGSIVGALGNRFVPEIGPDGRPTGNFVNRGSATAEELINSGVEIPPARIGDVDAYRRTTASGRGTVGDGVTGDHTPSRAATETHGKVLLPIM